MLVSSLKEVEMSLLLFLKGQMDAKSLQAALYQSEQKIEAVEEKWLRSLLSDAENKLEEIAYTVSRCNVSIGCSPGRMWETGVSRLHDPTRNLPDEQP
jgi:hypothetical protein